MSGESESVDYSGRLARLKERLKSKSRERPSICPTVLKPIAPRDPMEDKCIECFENNEYDTYFSEAERTLNDSKFAQRIVINKVLKEQQSGKTTVTDTIKAFKQYCKSHSKIVAFYLFLAEIYRSNGRVEDAEKCLDLIAVYNVEQTAKECRDKWVQIMKTKGRIIEYEISVNIDGFDIVGQKSESVLNEVKPSNHARRFSVRPKLVRKSAESSSDEDTNELSKSSKIQKTEPKAEKKQSSPSIVESAKEIIDREEVRKSKERKVAFQTTEKENFKPPSDPIRSNYDNKIEHGLKTPKNKTTAAMAVSKTPATISKEKTNYRKSGEHKITINGDDYTILDRLGQGGFSKVYKCRDKTGDIRALKYVDLSIVDANSREGIENEIEHLKNLRNERNIVQMFNHQIQQNKLFIVLEYGELDFQKYLHKNKGNIDNETLRYFWRQMVNAVSIVHSKGIIHRDLKPCNFLVCQGSLKLIDFGIANRISNDITSLTTDMVGTLNYMSPEQLQETEDGSKAVKVGKWADSWSLGCILYLMAYGELPFQGFKNNMMKISKIVDPSFEIKFPRHSCLGLVQILKICLDRNPKSRLLPEDILKSFFYNNKLDELIPFLEDDQFQEVYKAVKRLM